MFGLMEFSFHPDEPDSVEAIPSPCGEKRQLGLLIMFQNVCRVTSRMSSQTANRVSPFSPYPQYPDGKISSLSLKVRCRIGK